MEKELKSFLERKMNSVQDRLTDTLNSLRRTRKNALGYEELRFNEGYFKGQLSMLEHINLSY